MQNQDHESPRMFTSECVGTPQYSANDNFLPTSLRLDAAAAAATNASLVEDGALLLAPDDALVSFVSSPLLADDGPFKADSKSPASKNPYPPIP